MNLRLVVVSLVILLCLGACGQIAPPSFLTPEATAVAPVAVPTTSASATAAPTKTTAPPTAIPTASPTPSPIPQDLSLAAEDVYLYPVPQIYAGDLVTFQVLAYVPPAVVANDVTVHILIDYEEIVNGTLSQSNLAGNSSGLFEWAWNTTDLPGEHLVHVILDRYDAINVGDENPANNQVSFMVEVLDQELLPAAERNATWVSAETDCCVVHVVSGTAAYRDLADLLGIIDDAAEQTIRTLNEPLQQKMQIYLVDRVIGQGGYAGNTMVLSYLDRQYASNGFYQVTVHEMAHLIDRQFAPERIPFLAEGVAVWTAGGHYKPENINQRVAALIAIDQYVPLSELINNFYPIQHEIGYLQAAGFVDYLVMQHGWPAVRAFYSDVTLEDAETAAAAVDLNLQHYFGRTLVQEEEAWRAYLQKLPPDRNVIVDLQTTLRFYDLMRLYQQMYDPTAYFLTAWMPYPQMLREEGNPADVTRHPETELNITLEVMLHAADLALRGEDYNKANVILDSVQRVLDSDGVFIDPLAVNYWQVVQTAAADGFEVQTVQLEGDRAAVMATAANSTTLVALEMRLDGLEWVLLNY